MGTAVPTGWPLATGPGLRIVCSIVTVVADWSILNFLPNVRVTAGVLRSSTSDQLPERFGRS